MILGRKWLVEMLLLFPVDLVPKNDKHAGTINQDWNFLEIFERTLMLASALVPGSSAPSMWLAVDEQAGDKSAQMKQTSKLQSIVQLCTGFIFALKVLDKRQLIKHRVEHQLRWELDSKIGSVLCTRTSVSGDFWCSSCKERDRDSIALPPRQYLETLHLLSR